MGNESVRRHRGPIARRSSRDRFNRAACSRRPGAVVRRRPTAIRLTTRPTSTCRWKPRPTSISARWHRSDARGWVFAIKHASEPKFGEGVNLLVLRRQVRAGLAVVAREPGHRGRRRRPDEDGHCILATPVTSRQAQKPVLSAAADRPARRREHEYGGRGGHVGEHGRQSRGEVPHLHRRGADRRVGSLQGRLEFRAQSHVLGQELTSFCHQWIVFKFMPVRIGELLLKEKRITPDQLQQALNHQKANGGSSATTWSRWGSSRTRRSPRSSASSTAFPRSTSTQFEIDPAVIKLIPAGHGAEVPDRAARAAPARRSRSR